MGICLTWLVACRPSNEQTSRVEKNTTPPPTVVVVTAAPPIEAAKVVTPPPKKFFDPAVMNFPTGVVEVIKLSNAGVGEDVVLAFIEHSAYTFPLTADHIVYLNDLGMSPQIVSAMLRKEAKMGEPPMTARTEPAPPTTAVTTSPPPPVLPPTTPVTVVTPSLPVTTQVSPPPLPPVVTDTPAAQPVVVNNTFYSSLSPYGSWINVGDYGYCWQPAIVNSTPGWRPYSQGGRWLYTDYGWYWQSEYPWGWAAFHYGRWQHHSVRGWLWVPDTTWAPAWVSWRYSHDYCGWAPLPPGAYFSVNTGFTHHGRKVGVNYDFELEAKHYTYVPVSRFNDPAVHNFTVPTTQVRAVHEQTRVLNNYVPNQNNIIVNYGISRDTVAAASRTPVPQIPVRDLPTGSAAKSRTDHLEQQGNNQVLFRKVLADSTPTMGVVPHNTPITRDVIKPPSLPVPPIVTMPSQTPRPIVPAPVATRPVEIMPSPGPRPDIIRPNPAIITPKHNATPEKTQVNQNTHTTPVAPPSQPTATPVMPRLNRDSQTPAPTPVKPALETRVVAQGPTLPVNTFSAINQPSRGNVNNTPPALTFKAPITTTLSAPPPSRPMEVSRPTFSYQPRTVLTTPSPVIPASRPDASATSHTPPGDSSNKNKKP